MAYKARIIPTFVDSLPYLVAFQAYKAIIISTIVDHSLHPRKVWAYKAIIISTIVDLRTACFGTATLQQLQHLPVFLSMTQRLRA